jgi:hypothetical protein
MKMYFAYGSNLNLEQMAKRCPGAVPIGPAILKGYKLIFNYYASIENTNDNRYVVQGGLWYINKIHESKLDRYEGVSDRLYYKKQVIVLLKGYEVPALTYIMGDRPNLEGENPTLTYLDVCIKGYEDFNLPKINLQKLRKSIDT